VKSETRWDPAKLGAALKAEFAKNVVKKETMADVFGGGM
jgi:hypothetical protein